MRRLSTFTGKKGLDLIKASSIKAYIAISFVHIFPESKVVTDGANIGLTLDLDLMMNATQPYDPSH